MRCPSCGADNPAGSRICFRCNAMLSSAETGQTRQCVSCGRTISWDANVCPYCGHDFRVPQTIRAVEPISNGMKILFYLLSFLIPLAGFIIGAIYWSKPDESSKHVGKMCIIFAVVGVLLTVGLSALLYVMVLGFGSDGFTPAIQIISRGTVPNGFRFTLSSPTHSVVWSDLGITLSDSSSTVSWSPDSEDLTGPGPTSVVSGTGAMGLLSVRCSVTDIEGNGYINNGDSFELVTVSGDTFSPAVEYTLRLLYQPDGGSMVSYTFHG